MSICVSGPDIVSVVLPNICLVCPTFVSLREPHIHIVKTLFFLVHRCDFDSQDAKSSACFAALFV